MEMSSLQINIFLVSFATPVMQNYATVKGKCTTDFFLQFKTETDLGCCCF